MLKHKGNIKIDRSIEEIQDKILENIDTDYFMEKKHKWPSNNIEFNFKKHDLYGQVSHGEFYISWKHKPFFKNLDNIEIIGKIFGMPEGTRVEYEIRPKLIKLITIAIVDMLLILVLLLVFYNDNNHTQKAIISAIILVFLLLLNTFIPLGIIREIKCAENILHRILL